MVNLFDLAPNFQNPKSNGGIGGEHIDEELKGGECKPILSPPK